MIGQTLAHYRIDAKIGEGGMGVVYRATDTHLDRLVAIKVLAAEAVDSNDRKRRFVLEARAASALNHSNIVTIHDITSANGVDFIVMEFVAGRTLGGLIGRQGLPIAEALGLAVQIADALGRAHTAGIVHRDLKPANIMVSEDGCVKVLDFGLAKLTEKEPGEATLTMHLDTEPRTEAGTMLGTVAYMSPEQAEGKKIDTRSDIFSFGSVLYEMLTGRRAFQGGSMVSTLASILRGEPKPVSEVLPGVPREVERIIAQCLRKDPRRRFQHMEDIRVLLDSLREELQSRQLSGVMASPPPRGLRIPFALLPAVVATAALTGGMTWWLARPEAPKTSRGPVFTQITFDSGLTTDPALSPDGKLLAYASDRAGENNLDIWVQQVAGGQPVQITRSAADDHDPVFSSDGSKIAFRSEREPRGVYIVSTLGGDERLIAPEGRTARFSPDGKWIAYTGASEIAPKIYIVAAIGGAARELQTDTFGTFPIWSSDGKYLLFHGKPEKSLLNRDWLVVPVEGGHPVSTGMAEASAALGLRGNLPIPRAWSSEGILFSAVLGSSRNLWRVPIASKDWRVQGAPQRLTAGSGTEVSVSAAGKTLAFTSVNENVNLWSLPIDSKQGRVSGSSQRVTSGATEDGRPSVSADGRMLAYLSNRSGNTDVRLRDMTTGKEIAVTATPWDEFHPGLSRDGTKLCYAANERGKQVIYVTSAGSKPGLPEKLCDDCGFPMGWSPDGNSLVYWRDSPLRWFTIDVRTRQTAEVLPRIDHDIHNVQYSPNGGWLSFDVPVERTVFIAALKGRTAVGRSEWIRASEGSHPWWSPDGNLLYFLSPRDGFQCLWAQRLDGKTRQLAGENFAVQHFHGARRALNPASLGWGLASDKFILPIRETTGNVWLAALD